jgi:dethiobiotin synthetase
MRIIFVTGTGTDIGKTVVTAGLCYQFQQQGYRVRGIKPVISGWDEQHRMTSDTAYILQSLRHPITDATIAELSPWRFTAPLSPDMAAEHEQRMLALEDIADFCLCPKRNEGINYLIIEGAGGLMTPLTKAHTMLDLATTLDAEIILVGGSYLGSISHTLTALEVLRATPLKTRMLIVSSSAGSTVPLKETLRTLTHFTPLPIICLERFAATTAFWETLPDITTPFAAV